MPVSEPLANESEPSSSLYTVPAKVPLEKGAAPRQLAPSFSVASGPRLNNVASPVAMSMRDKPPEALPAASVRPSLL